jgi:tRNA nucleotidyltransferase (CCA-adding enzyme)
VLPHEKIPESVMAVLARLKERGFEAFLVGGCVRDMVRGATPKDYDVATSALPQEVQHSFSKTIPTGIEHGTVTVLWKGMHVEVTTFRSEGEYLDARRPSSVAFHTDIREDLSRRDFTINAMAYDPTTSALVDPFGGRDDLKAKLIRCVGTPQERFGEDGLRALRAVRFASVLGFSLDGPTEAAIPATLPSFRKIAHERIREEFTKLLLSDRPVFGVQLLERTGLLGTFLPEVQSTKGQPQDATYPGDVFEHLLATLEVTPPVLEVRLAALLHDLAKPRCAQPDGEGVRFDGHERMGEQLVREVMIRLKFPSKTTETVGLFVREHVFDEGARWTDGGLRRFVARLGEGHLEPFFTFLEANRSTRTDGERRRSQLRQVRERLTHLLEQRPPLNSKALALNGNQIMRILGVGPSPTVGEATRFLMEQVLDDPSLNSAEGLTGLLQNWARSKGFP